MTPSSSSRLLRPAVINALTLALASLTAALPTVLPIGNKEVLGDDFSDLRINQHELLVLEKIIVEGASSATDS